MYLSAENLGQTDLTYDSGQQKSESAQNIEAVAKLTQAIAEPAAKAYSEHVRAELNAERIKAGLPPLVPQSQLPPPPPPKEENFAIGGIALLVIIFLVLFKS